jgi:hypothetical protein
MEYENPTIETDDAKATRLLNRQLEELNGIRPLNYKHPNFIAWRDTTRSVLEKYLGPNSHHTTRFRDLRFFGSARVIPVVFGSPPPPPPGYISPESAEAFRSACDMTAATLRAAIRHIEDFGVYAEQDSPAAAKKGKGKSGTASQGGVHQTYNAPVTIHAQAIATDNAVQRIGQVGNRGDMGTTLKEIAELFQQSMDLTRRQVQEGLSGIEGLALEVQKDPPRRNWKSMIESGEKVLGIAEKATDLAQKLAPYTPAIVALVETARHAL